MKKLDNVILISGNGRNVGKTYFTCNLIKSLCPIIEVFALKVSTHFHEIQHNQKIVVQKPGFVVIEESDVSSKDSSLMQQSGAVKSYYAQSEKASEEEMALYLLQMLDTGKPFVVESYGLSKYLKPGLSFHIRGNVEGGGKKVKIDDDTNIVTRIEVPEFPYNRITFNNNQFKFLND